MDNIFESEYIFWSHGSNTYLGKLNNSGNHHKIHQKLRLVVVIHIFLKKP